MTLKVWFVDHARLLFMNWQPAKKSFRQPNAKGKTECNLQYYWSYAFSRVWRRLLDLVLRYDWFIWLFATVCDWLDFGFLINEWYSMARQACLRKSHCLQFYFNLRNSAISTYYFSLTKLSTPSLPEATLKVKMTITAGTPEETENGKTKTSGDATFQY